MVEGLRRISKSYPAAATRVEESGEHVIFGALGEGLKGGDGGLGGASTAASATAHVVPPTTPRLAWSC